MGKFNVEDPSSTKYPLDVPENHVFHEEKKVYGMNRDVNAALNITQLIDLIIDEKL